MDPYYTFNDFTSILQHAEQNSVTLYTDPLFWWTQGCGERTKL
jgi:hypothetical protein